MFNIGDKVVYPMHGAGIIESIEEKEILGDKQKYYVMRMPVGDMKVMIPMTQVDNIGLRQVVDEQTITEVIDRLANSATDLSSNWNRRYRANLDKMKSGDIHDIADVVRCLALRDREKGLSTGESKMLDNARQILISELVLVKGMDESQATGLLDKTIFSGSKASG
ncbi:CarD family transcriptional regulator [Melghirimyces algeriensis]|uniref:Transcriptional regulator, CarD family n=1 Tax=Melghirimyces algeriensis TaxID=910412 RepID=A0A521E823_9BACL|nr:CarD family transcriptional regulator [Melghirimyces algeriensis]SMO80096.1 transcriptional regulator, CarD family [Melghirimyces algeriensis]